MNRFESFEKDKYLWVFRIDSQLFYFETFSDVFTSCFLTQLFPVRIFILSCTFTNSIFNRGCKWQY